MNDHDFPLYGTQEAAAAQVVRCHRDHIALRTTFEDVGGCPYCVYTPGERMAAARAIEATTRRLQGGGTG